MSVRTPTGAACVRHRRSGATFDPGEVRVSVGGSGFTGARRVRDLDGLLAPHMRGGRFRWDIELGTPGRYVLLASDLSYDYVKINADYRS